MKPKVFVTRPLPASAQELLASACEVRSYPKDAAIPVRQLAEECREAEGVLVNSCRLSEEILQAAPRLRAVSSCSVGYDNIDVQACNRRRIPITNLAGSLEETTADMAFTLLLATARRAIEADRYVREGRWDRWQWGLLHGMDVHHKTLGLRALAGSAAGWHGAGWDFPCVSFIPRGTGLMKVLSGSFMPSSPAGKSCFASPTSSASTYH